MPRRATKFREDWLSLIDGNETKVSEWCVKGRDDFSAYCFLCKSTVNISNSGQIQLMQHASSSKHQKLLRPLKDSSQSRFVFSGGNASLFLDTKKKNSDQLPWTLSEEDKLCRVEILWVLHLVINNYSFQSCESVKELFCEMFPESPVPKGIQMSPRKVSYVISHGLGLYFLKQITEEFQKNSPFFTLMYDETLNEQNIKQLDIYLRYWNSKESSISERYIGSELMGHARALDIAPAIKTVLNSSGISIKHLLMLGSDGPKVNIAVFQIFDKEVKSMRDFGLINVGTCNLHVMHNGFGKGLKIETFTNVIDFLENIYCWFAKFPSRQEDLRKTMENFGEDYLKILRYVSNRWLSIVKVCERTLEVLPSLKKYFLDDLPKEKSRLVKNDRYQMILKMLKTPLTHIYLNFIISVGSLFEQFLKLLQKKTTLIHILYDEMNKLLIKLMSRFVKEDVLKEKYGEQLLQIDVRKEAVSLKQLDIGNNARKLISTISNDLKGDFLADAKEFYIAVTSYLQEKLPIKNKLLQSLQILHPVVRKESVKSTLPMVRRLANLLPMVIPEDCIDRLTDEWRLYVNDLDIHEEWANESESSKPIDFYWNEVFKLTNSCAESPRYPNLAILVKAVLTLSHGQASVERGFSVNKRMLSSERAAMNLDTIRGLRLIKDAVQRKATNMKITQEMIQFYKEAYSKYKVQKDLENAAKQKKKEEKVNPPEKKTCDKLVTIKDDISSAQSMIDEGNKRLQTGLKRKCMKEIEAAQALIEAGNKRLKVANDEIHKK